MPKAEFFNLRCGEDGILVELDEILLPAAKEVFLLGGCDGQFDPVRKGFYFQGFFFIKFKFLIIIFISNNRF